MTTGKMCALCESEPAGLQCEWCGRTMCGFCSSVSETEPLCDECDEEEHRQSAGGRY